MGVVTTEDEGYETPGSKIIHQKKTTSVKEKDTVREVYLMMVQFAEAEYSMLGLTLP